MIPPSLFQNGSLSPAIRRGAAIRRGLILTLPALLLQQPARADSPSGG